MTEMFIMNRIAEYALLIKGMAADSRMLPTHVSLVTALFAMYREAGFAVPFSVSRKKLMALSHIRSIATYHKCLGQLEVYGYIHYQPSYHPVKGSLVWWTSHPNRTIGERKDGTT